MESNINCHKDELVSIVQALFADKKITNVYVESDGNDNYHVIPNVFLRLTRTCTRCGGNWDQRIKGTPKRCPLCTSPYWNLPRESEVSKMRKQKKSRMKKGKAVRGKQ